MKNLQDATEKICEPKGSLLAMDTLLVALIQVLPPELRVQLHARFEQHVETARLVLLHAPISEHTIGSFDRDAHRTLALVGRS